MNPDIIRYVHASVIANLKPLVESFSGVIFYVEGVDKEIESAFNQNSALLRINGPTFYPHNGEDTYKVEIFVMLTELPGTRKNSYQIFQDAGKVAEALSQHIPVNRLGDDEALLGCLTIDRKSRDFVRIVNYGIIEKDVRIRQMAVIAKYEISL